MSSKWPKCRVEDLADKIAMGPFGSNIKVETFVDAGVPIISGDHLRGMRMKDGNFNFITEEHAERLRNSVVVRGDVIFTHAGNIGQVAYIPETSKYSRYVISQRQFYARCDKNKIVPQFLAYFFHTPEGRHKLLSNASQVGVPSIARPSTHLKAIELNVPPVEYQRSVCDVISALDDRITLLRETNATLEAIAQAIFKSWFVDFEPVRAKLEGRAPEGMDEATAALFPDSFEESELGLVPRGWQVGTLSDLATYMNGYAFKTKDWQETGHPVVKIGNVKPGMINISGASFVSASTVAVLERFQLKRGDLLVGMTGYVGETGLVPQIDPPAYLNQRVGRISTKRGIADLGFVYCLVRNPAYKGYAESKSHGSAQANVSGVDLMAYACIIPRQELLSTFSAVLCPIIERIILQYDKAQTLANLRDTLLPRLISGKLRLSEAENTIAEAIA